MRLSPIALFVYNRPWHTQQTVEALKRNELSKESELFIFSDAPKDEKANENVRRVREYIKRIDGFRAVTVILREHNLGLANSIINGVTEIINQYGKIIVLEDDMVTSEYFLRFMNDALDFYSNEEKVVSIHGYFFPIKKKSPETFFLTGADCWGWATWKRGWDVFEPDGRKLLFELRKRRLTRKFDVNGVYPYTKMLEGQIKGKVESWAILWYASAFLKEKFTLYPGRSLIRHIGNDGSGVNFGRLDMLDCKIVNEPIIINAIPIEEDLVARREIEGYLKGTRPPILRRMVGKVSSLLKIKKVTPYLKSFLERIIQLETKISSMWASSSHKRLFKIQWRIPPVPEHFDHQIDLFYLWRSTRNPLWLERGVFTNLALRGGTVLELCCGDGFNARNFYSLKSKRVVACDFDPKALYTARTKNSAPNVEFILSDIRIDMPEGRFDNIIWDGAIEHFTIEEICKILKDIKYRLLPEGVFSGHAEIEIGQTPYHEYQFKSKEELMQLLKPYFKTVRVFETIYPNRCNLYFWASDASVPFDLGWKPCIASKR